MRTLELDRHVRTPEGADWFDLPIGALISGHSHAKLLEIRRAEQAQHPREHPRVKKIRAAVAASRKARGVDDKGALAAHVAEHHGGTDQLRQRHGFGGPYQNAKGRGPAAELEFLHGTAHHRGTQSHRHEGANLGPDQRPPGWKTGEGVVPNEVVGTYKPVPGTEKFGQVTGRWYAKTDKGESISRANRPGAEWFKAGEEPKSERETGSGKPPQEKGSEKRQAWADYYAAEKEASRLFKIAKRTNKDSDVEAYAAAQRRAKEAHDRYVNLPAIGGGEDPFGNVPNAGFDLNPLTEGTIKPSSGGIFKATKPNGLSAFFDDPAEGAKWLRGEPAKQHDAGSVYLPGKGVVGGVSSESWRDVMARGHVVAEKLKRPGAVLSPDEHEQLRKALSVAKRHVDEAGEAQAEIFTRAFRKSRSRLRKADTSRTWNIRKVPLAGGGEREQVTSVNGYYLGHVVKNDDGSWSAYSANSPEDQHVLAGRNFSTKREAADELFIQSDKTSSKPVKRGAGVHPSEIAAGETTKRTDTVYPKLREQRRGAQPRSYPVTVTALTHNGKYVGSVRTTDRGYSELTAGNKTIPLYNARTHTDALTAAKGLLTAVINGRRVRATLTAGGHSAVHKHSSRMVRGWADFSAGYEIKEDERGVTVSHYPGSSIYAQTSATAQERQRKELDRYFASLEEKGFVVERTDAGLFIPNDKQGSGAIGLSADTARLVATGAPRGKPGGPGLYHEKGMGHSNYFQHIVKALIRAGHPPDKAYRLAWGAIRRWARGGGNVHPEVRAAAAAALAEENAKRAVARSHSHTISAQLELSGISAGAAKHKRLPSGQSGRKIRQQLASLQRRN